MIVPGHKTVGGDKLKGGRYTILCECGVTTRPRWTRAQALALHREHAKAALLAGDVRRDT